MFSRAALPFNGFEQALFGGACSCKKKKKGHKRGMRVLGTLALLKNMRRRKSGKKKKGGKKKKSGKKK